MVGVSGFEPTDAFVLHENEDTTVADEHAKRLTAAGFNVWLDDQTRIQSADSLQRTIADGLKLARCWIERLGFDSSSVRVRSRERRRLSCPGRISKKSSLHN